MVIGYNPSHSNVNSEVNAPFKILSLMLRYLDNEMAPKKATMPKGRRGKIDGEEEEKSHGTSGSLMSGYKMKRDLMGEGERLDTIDQNDDDDDNYNPPADLDYQDDEDDDQEALREGDEDSDGEGAKMKRAGAERIEVNLDDINDDDDNESLLGLSGGAGKSTLNAGLFTIKESHDRGLADMETGSEVYMSELLVRLIKVLDNLPRLALTWRISMRQRNKTRRTSQSWEIRSEIST